MLNMNESSSQSQILNMFLFVRKLWTSCSVNKPSFYHISLLFVLEAWFIITVKGSGLRGIAYYKNQNFSEQNSKQRHLMPTKVWLHKYSIYSLIKNLIPALTSKNPWYIIIQWGHELYLSENRDDNIILFSLILWVTSFYEVQLFIKMNGQRWIQSEDSEILWKWSQ